MKNTATFLSIALLFAVSCKKSANSTDSIASPDSTPAKFTIDSVLVKDSLTEGNRLELYSSDLVLVFPDIKNKTLQDSIYFNYPELKDYSKNGIEKFLKSSVTSEFSRIKKENTEPADYTERYSSTSKMKLISHSEDFLQLEYFQSLYSGGAHENYSFIDRVYDLKNNRTLVLNDITTIDASKLSAILRKNIDLRPGNASDDKGSIANSEFLLVDKIPGTHNFYFDDKNLYFHYSPYEIAAFAAGDIIIPVSWKDLEGTLTPDFKSRMKL